MISVAVRKFKPEFCYVDILRRRHTHKNETIHAAIERNKKRVTINHPFQWLTLIESACKKLSIDCQSKGPSIKYILKIFRKTNISNILIHTRTKPLC